MAQLSGKRKSWVERIREWPGNVRRTSFGYVHDQVWFPVGEPHVVYTDRTNAPIERRDGKLYQLYLDRIMLWFGFTIRLHKFYSGDDDSAVHDHPWWFITIPFSSYTETYMSEDGRMNSRKVRAFLPHFRRATHRHFVHQPKKPFRTIILTGRLKRNWGFWPDSETFVPHREWTNYNRDKDQPRRKYQ